MEGTCVKVSDAVKVGHVLLKETRREKMKRRDERG
jgi:hypothetical protein